MSKRACINPWSSSPRPHKKNSELEVSNYRPIFLLSSIDKMFKKLMHIRLIEFLEGKQILYYR